jgi:hypothetical protein
MIKKDNGDYRDCGNNSLQVHCTVLQRSSNTNSYLMIVELEALLDHKSEL